MAKKTNVIESVFTAQDRMSRPLGRMQRRIARVTRSMERGLRSVDRVTSRVIRGFGTGLRVGAAAATVAVTGLFLAVGKLADNMDELVKQTARLDFPIEDFQEYEFAATQSGVASDVFRKGMDKFARALGELRGGFGALETGLKKMDPQLRKQLKNTKNTSEAFELYVKAMREMPDASKKAALGSMAFGRMGIKMVNMAMLTEKQLMALRLEMRANGVMTEEQSKLAEHYNDALSSLKLAGAGLIRDVLAPLIPMGTRVARKFRELILANRELIKTKILEWGKAVVDNWSKIVEWAEKIGKGVAVFFALAGALKILIGILTVVNAVMAANPIGLIAVAVVAIVAALTAAYVWAEELRAVFDEMPLAAKALFAVLLPLMGPLAWLITAAVAIKTKWGSLAAFFEDVFGRVERAVKAGIEIFKNAAVDVVNAWLDVKNFFIDLWNGITEAFETAVNFLMTVGPISMILAAVAYIMQEWGTITAFFEGVWATVIDVFNTAVAAVLGVVVPLTTWFGEIWDEVFGKAEKAVDTATQSGAFKKILAVVDVIKLAWEGLKDAMASVWASIVSGAKIAVDKLLKFVEPVTKVLKSLDEAKNKLIGEQIGYMDVDRVERDERVAQRSGEEGVGGFIPQLVTPDERVSRSIEESRQVEKGEITIRDDTGRAEVTKDVRGMTLLPTGDF